MTGTATETPRATPRGARTPVGLVRQTLRLTRTEFTLFYRYRMALYVAVLPAIFMLPAFTVPNEEILPGVGAAAHSLAGVFAMAGMTVGIIHVSNVYAARREQMVLKRFRVSGVPPAALFGSTTLSVLGVVAIQSLIGVAVLAVQLDTLPKHPVLLVLSIVLITVIMSLLGAALTRFTRNAESAQMLSMVPFILLVAASGFYVPIDMMPEPLARIVGVLPMAPAIDLARSAYFGRDFFGGAEGAAAAGLDLWTAAGPALLVLLAWVAISVYLLRFFQWDPRQAK